MYCVRFHDRRRRLYLVNESLVKESHPFKYALTIKLGERMANWLKNEGVPEDKIKENTHILIQLRPNVRSPDSLRLVSFRPPEIMEIFKGWGNINFETAIYSPGRKVSHVCSCCSRVLDNHNGMCVPFNKQCLYGVSTINTKPEWRLKR
jgi:hypothetical protein